MDKSLSWAEVAATKLKDLAKSASPGNLVYSFNTRDGAPVMSGVTHVWRVDLVRSPSVQEKPQVVLSVFIPDKGNKSAMSFAISPEQVSKHFGNLPDSGIFYFIVD